MIPLESDFFVTGGTLPYDALSYVERAADLRLTSALRRGEFCYVLTARQMGKSSLMVRAALRLQEEGIRTAFIDLTSIGLHVTPEQWYRGMLQLLGSQLEQEEAMDALWNALPALPPVQRLVEVVRQVLLRDPEPVVVFVDEIDVVRSLPFTADEFFAAIRACYNRRRHEAEFNQLTFALLGVATPSDLIADVRNTPFNIGQRVDLPDFTEQEASVLRVGLQLGGDSGDVRSPQEAQRLLRRVLYWTSGHPYLTQRLCQEIAASARSERDVDQACERLFLAGGAPERDDNLIFVRERLLRGGAQSASPALKERKGSLAGEDLAGRLELYARVRRKRRVLASETAPHVSALRLSGIVRAERERLVLRNRIYERVFDGAWVAAHLPEAELRRQRDAYRRGLVRTATGASLGLASLGGLTLYAFQSAGEAERARGASSRLAKQYAVALQDAQALLYITRIQGAWRALLANNPEEARLLLEQERNEPGQPDRRGWEWHYLWSRCAEKLASFDERRGPVTSAVFLADGARIGSLSSSHEAVVRPASGGPAYSSWRPPVGEAMGALGPALFMADGDSLLRAVCPPPSAGGKSFSPFSPTAVWELRRVDLRSGKEQRLATVRGWLQGLSIAPGGRIVVTRGGEERPPLLLLDPTTGRTRATWSLPPEATAYCFKSDGQLLLGDAQGRVQTWDPSTGRRALLFSTGAKVSQLQHVAATGLIVAGNARRLHLWSPGQDKVREVVPAAVGQMLSQLEVSPDGRLLIATVGDDAHPNAPGALRVWRLTDRSSPLRVAQEHVNATGLQVSLAVSPSSTMALTGGMDGRVHLWRVGSASVENAPPLAPRFPSFTRFLVSSSDGGELGVRSYGVLTLYRPVDRTIRQQMAVPGYGPLQYSVPLRGWVVATERGLRVVPGGGRSPGQAPFASGAPGYSVALPTEVMDLHPHPREVLVAACVMDGSLYLWRPETGRLEHRPGPGGGVDAVRFGPDGSHLYLACRDGVTRCLSVETWLPCGDEALPNGTARLITFSPDGQHIAFMANQEVRLWDRTRRLTRVLAGHRDRVFSQSFSPDGRTLATGDAEGEVRLWNTATGQLLGQFSPPRRALVARVLFSSDGSTLFTAWKDGRFRRLSQLPSEKEWDGQQFQSSEIVSEAQKGLSNHE